MPTNAPVIFFSSTRLRMHAGGPGGYLANLKKGFDLLNEDFPLVTNSHKSFLPKILTFWCPIKKVRKALRLLIEYVLHGEHYLVVKGICPKSQKALLSPKLKWVIVNDVQDFVLVKDFVQKANPTIKIALMSHTPETAAKEMADGMNKRGAHLKWIRRWLLSIAEKVEKKAFEEADLLIFPTKEAMDPCKSNLPFLKDTINKKETYFIPTGCEDLTEANANLSIDDIKKKYALNDPTISFRVCYIGRHSSAKGFDILKKAHSIIAEKDQTIEFLIGGAANDEEKIHAPRWKEVGRVNPAEIFQVSDAFILPNRSTYFDLICLEALSWGIPTIASATGGNISVKKVIDSVVLFDMNDPDDAAQKLSHEILSMRNKSAAERKVISTKLRDGFLENYTLRHFAQNYVSFIEYLKKHD